MLNFEEVDMTKCERPWCGEAEDRVVDGHSLCARHEPGDLRPEVPIVRCEGGMGDCGLPARRQVAGYNLCADHEPRHCEPRRAA